MDAMDYACRAQALLKRMTLTEKLEYCNGVDSMYIRPLRRLGLRAIRMADASMGLRDDKTPATAFPASIALAATWNRERSAAYGTAVAEEFNAAGVDVLLGPGMNLYRVPHCGRNFEYLGEDPCLAAEMVVPYIRSVEALGVAATPKHLACNNSDWHRAVSNSVVDERTLREVYLVPFEAAVRRGKARALMTAYNLLNGSYCGEHEWLLRKVVLGEWNFGGLIMSDWNGLWSARKSMVSGLHLEMPGNKVLRPWVVRNLLNQGVVQEADVDAKAVRILEFALRQIDERESKPGRGRSRCPDHVEVALQTAREGIVLLRNEDALLPLDESSLRSVALVGPHATHTPTSGRGSARVEPVESIDLLDAVTRTAPGVKWLREDDDQTLRAADAVVVCVGYDHFTEGESFDRPFNLPAAQAELIERAVRANPRTIVVLTCGGGVDMRPWHDRAAAILHQWYPGEIGCLALAEILFGKVNPSGRLPITIERSFEDSAAAANYLPPGKTLYHERESLHNEEPLFDIHYAEGVFCGYRHFDAKGLAPLYPFGHGLSYTTFEYTDLRVNADAPSSITVTVNVTNTGARSGAETVQLYVAPVRPPVPRPEKELKGFAKVFLEAGQTREVRIDLSRRDFAYYDVGQQDWVVAPGDYRILAGSSSRDIRQEQTLAL